MVWGRLLAASENFKLLQNWERLRTATMVNYVMLQIWSLKCLANTHTIQCPQILMIIIRQTLTLNSLLKLHSDWQSHKYLFTAQHAKHKWDAVRARGQAVIVKSQMITINLFCSLIWVGCQLKQADLYFCCTTVHLQWTDMREREREREKVIPSTWLLSHTYKVAVSRFQLQHNLNFKH